MTLGTAEGIGEMHVRVNKAGNYEAVSCIDNEIARTTRKIFANCIEASKTCSTRRSGAR